MDTAAHPHEESLVMHAYGEGTVAERSTIAAHLLVCGVCRAVVDEIRDLGPEAAADLVPDPGADFEDRMWRRIAADLPEPRRSWTPGPLAAFAALAAALATVSVAGYWWIERATPSIDIAPPAAATSVADSRQRVLFAALDNHLGQTEMLLVEVLNAPDAAGTLGFEREVADDLIHSGRLYRATAEELGQEPVRSILDEMQPVLIEIARAPDDLNHVELAAIRERIDASDLLFKVRIAAQDVRDRQHEPGAPSGGAL